MVIVNGPADGKFLNGKCLSTFGLGLGSGRRDAAAAGQNFLVFRFQTADQLHQTNPLVLVQFFVPSNFFVHFSPTIAGARELSIYHLKLGRSALLRNFVWQLIQPDG